METSVPSVRGGIRTYRCIRVECPGRDRYGDARLLTPGSRAGTSHGHPRRTAPAGRAGTSHGDPKSTAPGSPAGTSHGDPKRSAPGSRAATSPKRSAPGSRAPPSAHPHPPRGGGLSWKFTEAHLDEDAPHRFTSAHTRGRPGARGASRPPRGRPGALRSSLRGARSPRGHSNTNPNCAATSPTYFQKHLFYRAKPCKAFGLAFHTARGGGWL